MQDKLQREARGQSNDDMKVSVTLTYETLNQPHPNRNRCMVSIQDSHVRFTCQLGCDGTELNGLM